jgi:hypothetical protein
MLAVTAMLACGTSKMTPSPHDDDESPIDDFMPVAYDAGSGGSSGAGGGTSNKPPAMYSDAGVYASPSTPGEVFCGPMTCAAGTQQCCITPNVGASCAASCSSQITFACDGHEDCSGGKRCCISVAAGDKVTLSCMDSCASAATTACHSKSDCPSDRPICCRNDAPIGRCLPPGAGEPGDVCDL